MSAEDAQKEHDDIQAEIAKEQGIDPETGKPLAKDKAEEHRDPADEDEDPTKDPADPPKKPKDDKDPEDPEEDEDDPEDEDPEGRKPKQRIPLSKLQDFKKKSRQEKETLISQLADKENKIKELEGKLSDSTTSEDRKKQIQAYAEKHGMEVDAVEELLDLVPKPTLDPQIEKSAKLIEIEGKKLQAETDFKNELDTLIEEFPEAEDVRDAIRKEAFKKENLSKSLYEIYTRYVKTETLPKKKTGEVSRSANRAAAPATTDIGKIIENAEKGLPGALEGLSDDILDKVFEEMGKRGSRYSK